MSNCLLVGKHKVPVNQHRSTNFLFSSAVWEESAGNIVVPGRLSSPVAQTHLKAPKQLWNRPDMLASACLLLFLPLQGEGAPRVRIGVMRKVYPNLCGMI